MHTIRLWLSLAMFSSSMMMFAQGAKNIIISEVQTANETGIEDAFGARHAWVELENTSFSTYNVRGMYIATDKAVLNAQLSVPERIKKMSVIPSGDDRTNLGARKHLLLFLNANPASIIASDEPTVPTPTAVSSSPMGALKRWAIILTQRFCSSVVTGYSSMST